jgi:hypothetical protein
VCEIVIVVVFVLCGIGGQDVSSGHYPRRIAVTAVEDKRFYRAGKGWEAPNGVAKGQEQGNDGRSADHNCVMITSTD